MKRSILLFISILAMFGYALFFSVCSVDGHTSKAIKNSSKQLKAKPPSKKPAIAKRSITVDEWFEKYDQIRRDAEMTMADKWQSLLLQAKKPEKKNAALATRMTTKYTIALAEMKQLGFTPETKPLQEGYIQYFTTARQLFDDYLAAQNEVPFTNAALVPTKKKLEVLDKQNKKIDDELRKQYIIKKTQTQLKSRTARRPSARRPFRRLSRDKSHSSSAVSRGMIVFLISLCFLHPRFIWRLVLR